MWFTFMLSEKLAHFSGWFGHFLLLSISIAPGYIYMCETKILYLSFYITRNVIPQYVLLDISFSNKILIAVNLY